MDAIKVAQLADGKTRPKWVTDEFYGYVEEFINQVAWVMDEFHGTMVQNRETSLTEFRHQIHSDDLLANLYLNGLLNGIISCS